MISVSQRFPQVLSRQPLAIMLFLTAVAIAAVIWQASAAAPFLVRWPTEWTLGVAKPVGSILTYIANDLDFGIFTFSEMTRGIAAVLNFPLITLRAILSSGHTFYGDDGQVWRLEPVPSAVLAFAATAGAFAISGLRFAVFTGVCCLLLLVTGLWTSAMATLASVLVAVFLSAVLALALGIWAYRSSAVDALLEPVYDIMQTMPVFSYLVLIVLLFGFGPVTALIATMIFAMPPLARVTVIALRQVPENISEFATIVGCSRRQRLWQVLLPAGRQTLLLGLNQVIMLALAFVIVASIIGAGGLGNDVLAALRALKVGDAAEAGLAITAIAIILDRLSRDFANRRPSHNPGRLLPWHRRHSLVLIVAIGAVLVWAAALIFPPLQSWPKAWEVSIAGALDAGVKTLNTAYYDELSAVRDLTLTSLLVPVKRFIVGVPWAGMTLVLGTLAYLIGGLRLALITGGILVAIALTGLWPKAMISLYLTAVATLVASLIGFPLGIFAALNATASKVLTAIVDTLQTLPTFVYLIPVVMLFSVGDFAAFLAIVLYSVVPAIRYTNESLRSVPAPLLEAAKMSGCTRLQTLFHVQLPTVAPQLLLGLNQTVVFAFSMLAITALVGSRGLEETTLIAIARVQPGEGLIAGLGIAGLSIIASRMITAAASATGVRS